MIKALFFDLHEVITHGDFRDIYRSFATKLELPHAVVVDFYRENLSGLLTGEVTTADELAYYGLKDVTEQQLLDTWTDTVLEVMTIDGRMTNLLVQLRKHFTLVAVTNLTPSRYGADVAMGLYEYFDHTVLSFKESCRKPEAKIYELAVSKAGVAPHEALFIDDQQKNVDAATALDIVGVTFESYDQLMVELKSHGVQV